MYLLLINMHVTFDSWQSKFQSELLSPSLSPQSSPQTTVQSRVQSPGFVLSQAKQMETVYRTRQRIRSNKANLYTYIIEIDFSLIKAVCTLPCNN